MLKAPESCRKGRVDQKNIQDDTSEFDVRKKDLVSQPIPADTDPKKPEEEF
ncbi:conserved hypothetical protein [delta proteobacterium NaphS2]|nr:conserved hypothetical protein [delta proteobacterium NaphS2]